MNKGITARFTKQQLHYAMHHSKLSLFLCRQEDQVMYSVENIAKISLKAATLGKRILTHHLPEFAQ